MHILKMGWREGTDIKVLVGTDIKVLVAMELFGGWGLPAVPGGPASSCQGAWQS